LRGLAELQNHGGDRGENPSKNRGKYEESCPGGGGKKRPYGPKKGGLFRASFMRGEGDLIVKNPKSERSEGGQFGGAGGGGQSLEGEGQDRRGGIITTDWTNPGQEQRWEGTVRR